MPRQELRTRQIEAVLGHIAAYAHAGHPLRMERRHGPREEDNEIVFSIPDWPSFVGVMEPGHAIAASSFEGRAQPAGVRDRERRG